jgi:septal ring factor EnvC (AmiA/AmiB activator)
MTNRDDKMTSMYMPRGNMSKKAHALLCAVTQSHAEGLILNDNIPELLEGVIKEHVEMKEQIDMLTEENEKLQNQLKEYKKIINEIKELIRR